MTAARAAAPGDATDVVRSTCPRDCYDACGIVVRRRGGRVVSVAGDRDHPVSHGWLCGKCAIGYNGAWVDPRVRLGQPLRRVGSKGRGHFAPAAWTDVLSEIAGRLRPIVDAGGARLVQTHYTGTCSLIAGNFPLRFLNRVGAVEVDPDSVCNKAGHIALQMTLGDSLTGFDPRTARDSACIVIWGANPSACAPHADRHWFRESPATKIVIDPIRHPTAAAADLHLQPFPGTDAALAFAMLHVIHAEGLLDHEFLARHTLGWGAVEDDIRRSTPAWAEKITGVPTTLIVEAARRYGRGPSLLWLGQGLQRQRFGGNVMRSCVLLAIATGMLGKPGIGVLYLNGFPGRGVDVDALTGARLSQGGARSISHMDLAAHLEDPGAAAALVSWNNNIAASSPEQARLRRALQREDLLHVAIDLFQTDTVDFADYVLPAASFLEFDDLVLSYFNYSVSAQVKVMEPLGEALPNQEIFRRLARSMGLKEPELFEPDDSLLRAFLKQTGVNLSFQELAAAGTVDYTANPVIPFADGRYSTPSGRVEIASERFVEAGLPAAPQPHVEDRPAAGKLRLLSPANAWLMNSSFGNEDRVRHELGSATAFFHPADAAARGIGDGSPVRLSNDTGTLTATAGISGDVPAGVVLAPKGRWPKHERGAHNVNVLVPGEKADLGESTCLHSVQVSAELA